MSIVYDEKHRTLSLHTKNTTYQIGIGSYNFLLHYYYGARVEGSLSYLLSFADRGFSANPYDAGSDRTFSMDVLPQEYPCYGTGDYRTAGFHMKDKNGIYGCDLRYRSHKIIEGKYAIPGLPAVYAEKNESQTLELMLADERAGVEVILQYGVLEELDVITRAASIKNIGSSEIFITKACSGSLDFLYGDYDILHFHGRHGMERNLERIPVIRGRQVFGSNRGTSSHQHNPFVILAERETTEDKGDCYGMSLLYSGNFCCETEGDQYGQTRTVMGLASEFLEYKLKPEDVFYTPELAMSYTNCGLTQLSQNYHRLIREHICRGQYRSSPRPVLINNWEATYFDFTGKKIVEIAKQAAELGVEMLVLDDGWFGSRNTDNSGLGDWFVNEEKMGGSLSEVVKTVNDLGMKFGLWIEPEMVNEDSELYRNHPDWAFVIPGRKPVRGRNQLVLDFSRKEVVNYIFEAIAKVLDASNIEYIKMDMNRSITDVYTATEGRQNQGTILYHYVLGVYEFLERMIKRYPSMLIEGCSGGGGRFDAGMLYYTPQIWCSDNTDAIERLTIQHGTSFGYPISAVGSHVSAVPNEQTGRRTNILTRGVVAMAGTFGYELDLNLISEEEKEFVKQQIKDYKRFWSLINQGLYYRLTSPLNYPEFMAWEFVALDGREALLNVVTLATHCNGAPNYIRMKGLLLEGIYELEGTGRSYSGSALMNGGVLVPFMTDEYQAWQAHFVLKEK